MKTIFDLPAELRNDIYRYALESASVCVVLSNGSECHEPLGILLAAKAVRKEVLSLIHRHGNIHVEVVDLDFGALLAFTTNLNTQQRAAMNDNPNLEIRLRRTESLEDDAVLPGENLMRLKEWVVSKTHADALQPCWTYTGSYTDHIAAARVRREGVKEGNKEKLEYAAIYSVWGKIHY